MPHGDEDEDDGELPPGWGAWIATDGRTYYHHRDSGVSQWDRPLWAEPSESGSLGGRDDEAGSGGAAAASSSPGRQPGVVEAIAAAGGPSLEPVPKSSEAFALAAEEVQPPASTLARVQRQQGEAASDSTASAWHAYAPGRAAAPLGNPPQPPVGQHVPCLLDEAVRSLLKLDSRRGAVRMGGRFIDCTFGRGGHSRAILKHLSEDSRLMAFDVDPSAVAVGQELMQEDARFSIVHRPFAEFPEELGNELIDGILMDLGVSSPQLDERGRGFNAVYNGPLDLRMNPTSGISAAEWLDMVTVEELAWVIAQYGEDEDVLLADRIAQAVMDAQRRCPITGTKQLAEIVRRAKLNMDYRGTHPAKLTFQAIRVFLNHEMEQLETVLENAFNKLEMEGRCVIITFKRMEALLVRSFQRRHEEPPDFQCAPPVHSEARLCELYPLLATNKLYTVCEVAAPLKPSLEEVQRNYRARSAMLHVLQKKPRTWPSLSHAASFVRDPSLRYVRPSFQPEFAGARRGKPWSEGLGASVAASMLSDDADRTTAPPSSGDVLPSSPEASREAREDGCPAAVDLWSLPGADPWNLSRAAATVAAVPPVPSAAAIAEAAGGELAVLARGPPSSPSSPSGARPPHDEQPGATASREEAAIGSAGHSRTRLCTLTVVADYHGDEGQLWPEGYLQVHVGDQIHLLYVDSSEPDWAFGRKGSEEGWFPWNVVH